MATFLYKTKGNANPKGKPRVYFTSHPEDFDRYLDKLCEDVFKTHDCAIYYTESMTEAIDEHDMDADLGQMNLFVVPVTFRLLSQPNRAMDVDLAYAKQQNIAILPFMMESGIDAFYSAPEKFGQRQYINPYSTDTTEISYADKLKKYLEAVLISDETAQRVRDAFDAYIFLSYRKKDRRYANQLMRLIHKNPEYRDIAIWYDEFLTPGESFKQNIDKAMQQSKLFTLLVTPSLLEYVDGKPNFVMGVEYPAAKSAGMGVLPAEMVETDKAELREKYADIPDCVTAQDEPALRQRLLDALDQIAKSENNNDPEHNFLIGLAYLDGIDVEVDTERAMGLITRAAGANLIEAQQKLVDMYWEGHGTRVNRAQAIRVQQRIVETLQKRIPPSAYKTAAVLPLIEAQKRLAGLFCEMGQYDKALPHAKAARDLANTLYLKDNSYSPLLSECALRCGEIHQYLHHNGRGGIYLMESLLYCPWGNEDEGSEPFRRRLLSIVLTLTDSDLSDKHAENLLYMAQKLYDDSGSEFDKLQLLQALICASKSQKDAAKKHELMQRACALASSIPEQSMSEEMIVQVSFTYLCEAALVATPEEHDQYVQKALSLAQTIPHSTAARKAIAMAHYARYTNLQKHNLTEQANEAYPIAELTMRAVAKETGDAGDYGALFRIELSKDPTLATDAVAYQTAWLQKWEQLCAAHPKNPAYEKERKQAKGVLRLIKIGRYIHVLPKDTQDNS